MKLKYVISFGVICLVSLVSVLVSIRPEAQELNREFTIATLYGDEGIVDELAFSAIIREGRNRFTRVTLATDGPQFEPTIFDRTHWLGEAELENRELYRHSGWGRRVFETADFKFVYEFDSSFAWRWNVDASARIARLDKGTGEVNVLNHTFAEIESHMHIWNSFLVESGGGFYYVLPVENQRLDFFVYSLDVEAMVLTFAFRGSVNDSQMDRWGNWFATEHGVYVHMSNVESGELYTIDFEARESRIVDSDFEFLGWPFASRGHQMIFENHVFDEETENWATVKKVANMETGATAYLEPSFLDLVHGSVSGFTNRHSVTQNYLVLNFTLDAPLRQFIAIYDLDALELLYEGEIRLRHDQGLIMLGWWPQGFDVGVRDF